jgi:large subunit ribosomal protein L25
MAQMIKFTVDAREVKGRKVKQLRRQGKVPGNVFGKKMTSQSIEFNLPEFTKLYSETGETSLIELVIKGDAKSKPVLISAVQNHPVTGDPIHVDFHAVDLKEKVTATVPVEIIGESPAVTDKDGVLLVAVNEIEVEALPADLPENIEVDIAGLTEIGDSIQVKDLKLDTSKIELQIDPEATLVTIQAQAEEEVEPTPEPEEPAEGETPGRRRGGGGQACRNRGVPNH